MKLWGQLDLKPVLVTLISGVILSAGGFLWAKVMKVDVLEAQMSARMSRIEDTQEAILSRLPPPPGQSVAPAKGSRR